MWHPDPRIRPPMAEAARRFREIFGGSGASAAAAAVAAESLRKGGEGDLVVDALPPLVDVGAAAYDKAALSPPAESGDASGGVGAAEAVAAAEAATAAAAAAGAGEAFGED